MSDFTITLDEAKEWAASWRTNPPKDLAKGHWIPGEALSELLATEGVVDVRAYMGVDETGTQCHPASTGYARRTWSPRCHWSAAPSTATKSPWPYRTGTR